MDSLSVEPAPFGAIAFLILLLLFLQFELGHGSQSGFRILCDGAGDKHTWYALITDFVDRVFVCIETASNTISESAALLWTLVRLCMGARQASLG